MRKSISASNRSGSHTIVVIGGSAGSIELIIKLLKVLPKQLNVSIVIVVHRMRNINSNLEKIFLSKSNVFCIKEADEKEKIQKGCIYIAPSNYHLLFEEDETFSLDYSEPINFSRPSIDVSFESAADVFGRDLVLILLSGANDDGSKGMAYAKENGAITIVQDPQEAEYKIMPASAIKNFQPHHIWGIKEISSFIKDLNKSV